MLEIGPFLKRVLDSYLESRPAVEAKIEEAIKLRVPLKLDASVLADVRQVLARAVDARDVRPGLCRCLGDPGDSLEDWFLQGAPAGVQRQPELARTFPPKRQSELIDPDALFTDEALFSNYVAFERCAEARETIQEYIRKGYLQRLGTMDQATMALGRRPVLSRFGVIERVRENKVKRRVILDAKQSGITAATQTSYHVSLPKATDVVNAILSTAQTESSGDLALFVCDFRDAFWQVPLHTDEVPFFCGLLDGEVVAYRRTAQGSLNGPLTWAAVGAAVMRVSQALFFEASATDPFAQCKLNLYVDDPIAVLAGTAAKRSRHVHLLLLLWVALGLELATEKCAFGRELDWCGLSYKIGVNAVCVTIKESRVRELTELVCTALRANVVPSSELRTLVGKAASFATLLFTWRPFMSELYTALHDDAARSSAPSNCCWTRQVEPALVWIQAFLSKQGGALIRRFAFDAFSAKPQVMFITDASPWGLGGVLIKQGTLMEWYTSPLGPADLECLKISLGESSAQQAAEALALLVALRLWKHE
eukprot:6490740-Amphidinium_carterae.1